MGLHNSISQIRGQILIFYPFPSIGYVFSLILQEEAQCEVIDNQTFFHVVNVSTIL